MIPNDQAVFSPEGILPLHGNRQTMILHELAHYYSPFGNVYGKEVYDPQAAAELPAEKQLTETYNYALYYAGQYAFRDYFVLCAVILVIGSLGLTLMLTCAM